MGGLLKELADWGARNQVDAVVEREERALKPHRYEDPNGKVECHGCDELGRPRGGVTTSHEGARVHVSFTLPEGWAVGKDGAVLCGECAAEQGARS